MTTKLSLDEVLDILAWNVRVVRNPGEVRFRLRVLLKENLPAVVVLLEATRLYNQLQDFGYQVVHLKPRRRGLKRRRRRQPGEANVAIMVRSDIPLRSSSVLRMLTPWRGPKMGLPQAPRVYRWIRIEFAGKIWKIGGAHTPFGKPARLESRNRLVQWFTRTLPGRPTVLLIDSNMSKAEFDKTIADPAGAEFDGARIDLAAYRNADLVSMKNLGKHGSDHPAMLYGFVAE